MKKILLPSALIILGLLMGPSVFDSSTAYSAGKNNYRHQVILQCGDSSGSAFVNLIYSSGANTPSIELSCDANDVDTNLFDTPLDTKVNSWGGIVECEGNIAFQRDLKFGDDLPVACPGNTSSASVTVLNH